MPGKDLIPRPMPQLPAVTGTAPPFAEPKKRESESALAWMRKRRHWTVPATVPLAALAAGAITWHVPLMGKVGILAGAWVGAVVMTLFAPLKWKDAKGEPRWPEVVYAVASAFTAAAWLSACAIVGISPWSLVPVSVLSLAWGIPWYTHKRPRGARKRAALVAKWDSWWQSLAPYWTLAGSAVIDVTETAVTTKLRIAGLPGRHSIQHVRQVMHLIESGLDGYVDIGRIRAEPVKGKPSHFDLFLKQENPLKETVEYDMAMAPRSVHEPLIKGLTETGGWKTVSARCNSFTIGATRTGKSNDLLVRLAQLTGCRDDWQILIDLKGGRSARPVLRTGTVAYVVTEIGEARLVLLFLVAEIKARAKNAYDGNEQLHATEDVPAWHLEIDEVHGLTSTANGDTECARLLALVASLGAGLEVYVDVYTQHGSLEESVRTEQTRGNLPLRTCYRVSEARHGAYVLPEYHKLDASALEEQGTSYVKDGPDASSEQVRAPHMPHQLLEQVTAQNAIYVSGRPKLKLYCGEEMAPTGVTWQEWWDTRWLRLDPAFRKDSPQYAEAIANHSPAPQPESVPATLAAAAGPGDQDARNTAARIEAELAVTAGAVMAGPPPQVNLRPVIEAQEEAFAAALQSAPPGGISPKQLAAASRRGRTWVHTMLKALVETGAVTQAGRGLYAPVPGAPVLQAMRQIQERNENLYREAKALVHAA